MVVVYFDEMIGTVYKNIEGGKRKRSSENEKVDIHRFLVFFGNKYI